MPYFETTLLDRKYIDLEKTRQKKYGESVIDVRTFLDKHEVFVFFMKNIV